MASCSRVTLVLIALAALCAGPAAAAESTIAKPECNKPDFPGKLASQSRLRVFNNEVKAYGDCIKAYVAVQQKIADDHIKAANEAADDYNKVVKELQADVNAAKE